jgi:amino acid transporter
MMYAFSRDGGLPSFFDSVDKKHASPVRTVWLSCLLAFILALPSLGSSVAFSAATSIATTGLYISYTIPIAILLIEHKRFLEIRGPWNLGALSWPVALVATLWVTFVTIIFCLPTVNPVTSQTINYTVAAVGAVTIWSVGSWVLWARRWFKGPRQAAFEDIAAVPDAPLARRCSDASENKAKVEAGVREVSESEPEEVK